MPDHTIERLYRIELYIEHDDCGYFCGRCSGSGEGMADGTSCYECRGLGEIKGHHEGTREFVVEWFNRAYWEVIDGDLHECEGCGYDFMDEIEANLNYLLEQGEITDDENR